MGYTLDNYLIKLLMTQSLKKKKKTFNDIEKDLNHYVFSPIMSELLILTNKTIITK